MYEKIALHFRDPNTDHGTLCGTFEGSRVGTLKIDDVTCVRCLRVLAHHYITLLPYLVELRNSSPKVWVQLMQIVEPQLGVSKSSDAAALTELLVNAQGK